MAYIYRIENTITNEFYIGSRIKDAIPHEDLWIKYFTSSKLVAKLIEQHGKDSFTTEIVEIYDDKNQCYIAEQHLIKANIKNPLCLNKQYRIGGERGFYNIDPDVRAKRRVSINGIVYKSITAAGTELKLSKDVVSYRCKSDKFPDWSILDKERLFKEERKTIKSGKITKQDVADNLFNEMYTERIDSNFDNFYNDFCVRFNAIRGTRNKDALQVFHIAKNRAGVTKSTRTSIFRQVSINDVIYKSIVDAAAVLNLSKDQVAYRCKSVKYAEWYKL
jgi:hypothetical protein